VIFKDSRYDVISNLKAEGAIAFELRLAEPLVERGLVREFRMSVGVAPDRASFGPVISRLEIKDEAILGGGRSALRLTVRADIIDQSNGAVVGVGQYASVARALLQLFELNKADLDAEIDVNLAHRIAQIGKAKPAVAARINRDDEAAAPTDGLVQAEVFEMPPRPTDIRRRCGRWSSRTLRQ
jgi:hypothetical protein